MMSEEEAKLILAVQPPRLERRQWSAVRVENDNSIIWLSPKGKPYRHDDMFAISYGIFTFGTKEEAEKFVTYWNERSELGKFVVVEVVESREAVVS